MTVTSCMNLFNYLITIRIVVKVSRTIVAIGLMAMTVMLTSYTIVKTVQALTHCSACKVADRLKQREQEIQVDPHVPEPSKSFIVKLVDQATPKFAEGVGCSPLDPRGC
jgi:hypothetical protein